MNNMLARYLLLLALATTAWAAAWASPEADKAAKAYEQEHYQQALAIYEQMAKQEGTSALLYYNMGNTYYRLKDTGHAILYYERALLLDPTNKDARFNLEFVRQKAGIVDQSGSSVYARWLDRVVSTFPSNTWAVLAVLAFLFSLAGCALFVFMDNLSLRKWGFFGGIVMLIFSLMAYLCASHMRDKATLRQAAIVMEPAELSTVPRQPKDSAEVAFKLPVGAKVTITDSARTQQDLWLNVDAGNRQEAWLPSKQIEII